MPIVGAARLLVGVGAAHVATARWYRALVPHAHCNADAHVATALVSRGSLSRVSSLPRVEAELLVTASQCSPLRCPVTMPLGWCRAHRSRALRCRVVAAYFAAVASC